MELIARAKAFFRGRALPGLQPLVAALGGESLVIADIGATGGPEARWLECANLCKFITFDPDPRATCAPAGLSVVNHPVGLWSGSTRRILYLAAFPASSSVYELNGETLHDFLNAPGHEVVATRPLDLDSMESALADEDSPDFIKIDAEGADLEILKGACSYLDGSCLAVQLEVSFIERHKSAPYFAECDMFLRERGFMLLDLNRDRWIRRNGLYGLSSRPQAIWGNAVYVLQRAEFLKRLAKSPDPKRRIIMLAKAVLVLLVYRAHDYALELVEHADTAGLVAPIHTAPIAEMVRDAKVAALPHLLRLSGLAAVAFLILIVLAPIGPLRRRALSLAKRQTSALAAAILAWSCRGGPYNASISDPD